jgi:ABC-type lipoprotein release transport system permease subunit
VLLVASAALGVCAVIAGVIPAMKASAVDPVEALRT